MATNFVSAAEDELTCPVCLQFYTSPHVPKNLPKCAHILCRLCLQKITEGGLKTIKCPQCNKVSNLPEDGIDGLTTSLVVRNLAEKHPAGIKQRNDQIQEELHRAKEQTAKRLLEAKEYEKQIQTSIEQEERDIQKSVELVQAQAHAQAQELLSQIKSLSGLAEIKQHIAQLETRVTNIQTSQSELKSMSDDEFCSQTDALTNKLRKLQMDCKPQTNTNQCVSKFIANEHVQLGRIANPRRLEWVQLQGFGHFEDAISITSKSNGMFAVYYDDDKTVTLFHYENSQFKKHHQFVVDRVPHDRLRSASIALHDNGSYLVAPKFAAGFNVHSSNGKHLKSVSVKDPKQTHEIKATVYISTISDGKILTGSVTRDNLNVLTILDAKYTFLKTIMISIFPFCFDDIRGTHVAVSDYSKDKVCVYDLQSGTETLNVDIQLGPEAICYDKQSDCMLIGRYTMRDEIGDPVFGTGVIDQYCSRTGKLVACLAQGLRCPREMAFVDDNALAVTSVNTVKLCQITDIKPAQPREVVSDSNLDSKQDFRVCSNPDCAKPANHVPGGLKRCTRCHNVAYCGPQCQRKDWKSHRTVCGKQ